MKTEELIREYMKTHKSGIGEGKRAETQPKPKTVKPSIRKG